jgi:hypothetical protein
MTAYECRREHLLRLIDKHGGLAALNRKLDRAERDATLGQIAHGHADSKTGKPRQMGDKLARQIEDRLGLKRGELDTPPTPAPPSAASPPPAPDPLEVLAAKLDALEPSMREHAVDTLKRYLLAAPAERARWRPLVDPLLLPTADPDRVAAHLQPAPRKRKTK